VYSVVHLSQGDVATHSKTQAAQDTVQEIVKRVTKKNDFWDGVDQSKIFKDKEGQKKVFDMSAFETAMNDKKVATTTQTAAKTIVRGFLTPEVDASAWTVKIFGFCLRGSGRSNSTWE